MKTCAILQARMSSIRLPGKVLKQIAGKPLLQYSLERLARCENVDEIIVATSTETSDDPIAEFCLAHDTICFRGDLANVAKRYIQAFSEHPFDLCVRICGDSPMIDAVLVGQVINLCKIEFPDLATNRHPRSFPKGQSVEVFSPQILISSFNRFSAPQHFEHVTAFFYENDREYAIANLHSGCDLGQFSLCVDTLEEMKVFEKMVQCMDRPHWQYSWRELVELKQQTIGAVQ